MATSHAWRRRLLPILLSLAAHVLVLGAVWHWPGANNPEQAQVFDTRIQVSLQEPPSLHESSEAGSSGDDAIRLIPQILPASSVRNADTASPSEHDPRLVSPVGAAAPLVEGSGRGGEGRGRRRTRLLAEPAAARRVVYVLDRSVSMGLADALDVARREVLASMERLPAEAQFQVIAYNEQAEPLWLGRPGGWLPVEPVVLEQVARFLAELNAAGESRHLLALQRALALQPDLVFFVTDAGELTLDEVRLITRLNGRRAILHTLELTGRRARPDGPLGQLASANGGTYRCAAPQR